MLALTLVLAMVLALSGCMRDESVIVVDENGVPTITESVYIDKTALETYLTTYMQTDPSTLNLTDTYKIKTIDGKDYLYTDETLNIAVDPKQYMSMTITKDIFYMPISSAYSLMNNASNQLTGADDSNPLDNLNALTSAGMEMFYDMIVIRTVTLPSEIVYTNGELSADKKTVSFSATMKEILASEGWYAMTAAGKEAYDNDTTAPVISGIKDGDVISSFAKLSASDNVAIKSYAINGSDYQISFAGDEITLIPIDPNATIKQGKNTLTVTDIKDNSSSISFTYDTVAAKITGAKDGKTYKKARTLKIKDACGIAKVVVNGKSKSLKGAKSYSVKAKKKGKNVVKVTDLAGNVTKLTFKIKKK